MDMTRQGATVVGAEGFSWPLLLGQTAVGPEVYGYFHFPIRDFVRCVAEGGPCPIPVREGLNNIKIVAAARQSIESEQTVELSW